MTVIIITIIIITIIIIIITATTTIITKVTALPSQGRAGRSCEHFPSSQTWRP